MNGAGIEDDMLEAEKDILSQDDATLLLYVAGELDELHRRTLDERLSGDASLRQRLEELTSLDRLMRGEAEERPVDPVDSRVALAGALRLVREQALILGSRPPLRFRRRRLAGVPRWAWGSAIAASVAVGALVWVTNSDPPAIPAPPTAQNSFFGGRGDGFMFAQVFSGTDAEGIDSSTAGEIATQLDALETLATMDEPILFDPAEADSTQQ